MRKRTEILGMPVDCVTRKEALEILLEYLNEDRNHIVITPNPEMIMTAREDQEFMEVVRKADLVVPDGTGVVLASIFTDSRIKERVPGCDLTMELLGQIKDTGHTVYLLGAAKGVAEMARENMQRRYPGLKIIGVHDGYFDTKEERVIIKEIQRLKPDCLIVGSSFPKGEKWLHRHKKRLPVKIGISAGGTINIMAGTVKRAPKPFRMLGLEWLYRLISQPSRFKRMLKLPLFVVEVLKERR